MPDPALHSKPAIDLVVRDLGRMPYAEAYELQKQLQREVIESRGEKEPGPSAPPAGGTSGPACGARKMYLILVEHDPPVITVSRRKGARDHLLASEAQLREAGVEICETDRGGDITYHGPGQLVAYPILDLNVLRLRIHSYMRFLEQVVIDTLQEFGIEGKRDAEATGVWVGGEASRHQGTEASSEEGESHEPCAMSHEGEDQKIKAQGWPSLGFEDSPPAKICAMGVRVSRWVSMHGLALNVNPDLDHFDLIVPCGLAGRSVTSLKRELGNQSPGMQQAKEALVRTFRSKLTAEC